MTLWPPYKCEHTFTHRHAWTCTRPCTQTHLHMDFWLTADAQPLLPARPVAIKDTAMTLYSTPPSRVGTSQWLKSWVSLWLSIQSVGIHHVARMTYKAQHVRHIAPHEVAFRDIYSLCVGYGPLIQNAWHQTWYSFLIVSELGIFAETYLSLWPKFKGKGHASYRTHMK